MKNFLLPLTMAIMFTACNDNADHKSKTVIAENVQSENSVAMIKNFYSFKTNTLSGEEFDFEQLRGKRVLIVNTASECGYTPQYEQLQELHDKFSGEDFTILGFPSNDFGGQEPGTNEDIAAFCKKNFGVTFTMMEKNPVKGDEQQEVYKWLTHKELNGVGDAKVIWNFNKFLIDEQGNWVAHKPSSVSPLDEDIVNFAKRK